MTTIYRKTKGLQDTELHYCPGCAHGIVHKLDRKASCRERVCQYV